MDAGLCKIKLGMSIFSRGMQQKNAVQPDFTETLKCVHFTVLLSLNYFFKNMQYFSCIKVKTTMLNSLILQSLSNIEYSTSEMADMRVRPMQVMHSLLHWHHTPSCLEAHRAPVFMQLHPALRLKYCLSFHKS